MVHANFLCACFSSGIFWELFWLAARVPNLLSVGAGLGGKVAFAGDGGHFLQQSQQWGVPQQWQFSVLPHLWELFLNLLSLIHFSCHTLGLLKAGFLSNPQVTPSQFLKLFFNFFICRPHYLFCLCCTSSSTAGIHADAQAGTSLTNYFLRSSL